MAVKNPHGFDVRKANADFRRDSKRRDVVVHKASAKSGNASHSNGRCVWCRQKVAFCWCKKAN